MTNLITSVESVRLFKLEDIIRKGQKTFVEVGLALAEIQEKKLYRAEHGSFEKYCERVWGWSKQHAYRLIEAAPVAKSNPQVINLASAKALAKVPPPKRKSVVAEIVKSGQKVTAQAVSKASALPLPPRRPATRFLDATGLEVPKEALALWNRMDEPQALLTQISNVRSFLRKAQSESDVLYVEVDFSESLAMLNQAFQNIKTAIPYAICPSCSGVDSKNCPTCLKRGFVSQFYWEHNVPEEIKKVSGRK